MKKIKFTIAIVLLLAISCKQETAINSLIPINIDPDKVAGVYDIASDVEAEWEIIPLETGDDYRFTHISRVISQNGKYYVLDNKSIIYLFDATGKFLRKLDSKGNTFDVIGDDVWVYNKDKQRLTVYDSLLNQKEETGNAGIAAWDIKHVGQNIYLASSHMGAQNKNCQVAKYSMPDKTFNCLMEIEKTKTEVGFQRTKQIVKYGDSCMFFQSYCDTLFQIRDNALIPKYRIAFSSRYQDIPLSVEQYKKQDKETINGLMELDRTQNSIIFSYLDKQRLVIAIYSELTGQSQVYLHFQHSDLGNLTVTTPQFAPNREIICQYASNWLADEKIYTRLFDESKFNLQKLKNAIAGLKMEDNPILIKFKLKKDSKL